MLDEAVVCRSGRQVLHRQTELRCSSGLCSRLCPEGSIVLCTCGVRSGLCGSLCSKSADVLCSGLGTVSSRMCRSGCTLCSRRADESGPGSTSRVVAVSRWKICIATSRQLLNSTSRQARFPSRDRACLFLKTRCFQRLSRKVEVNIRPDRVDA